MKHCKTSTRSLIPRILYNRKYGKTLRLWRHSVLIFGVLFMRRAVPFIGGYGLALAAIWVPNAMLANLRCARLPPRRGDLVRVSPGLAFFSRCSSVNTMGLFTLILFLATVYSSAPPRCSFTNLTQVGYSGAMFGVQCLIQRVHIRLLYDIRKSQCRYRNNRPQRHIALARRLELWYYFIAASAVGTAHNGRRLATLPERG